jgi:hypothetical protein
LHGTVSCPIISRSTSCRFRILLREETYNERPSVLIERPIIIKNIDELKIMSLSDFVIVRIMSGCDFDSTSSEFHIDRDGIGDDRQTAIRNERVGSEFAVEMLSSFHPC